jgi:hypothetical protein
MRVLKTLALSTLLKMLPSGDNTLFQQPKLLGLAAFAFCLSLQGVSGAEELNARAIRETRALFDVAVGDKSKLFKSPGARCRFDTEWPKEIAEDLVPKFIPDALARQYLGLRAHASLVRPSEAPSLQEILDPQAEHSLAFCSENKRSDYIEEHRKNVESGEEEDYWRPHDTYSLPLFDKTFQKAIIVVTHSSGVFHNRAGGWPGFLNCAAQVYTKSEGAWRLDKAVKLCVT